MSKIKFSCDCCDTFCKIEMEDNIEYKPTNCVFKSDFLEYEEVFWNEVNEGEGLK